MSSSRSANNPPTDGFAQSANPSGLRVGSKQQPQSLRGTLERVAPHSMDSEQALLASCIIEGGQESITRCIEAKIGPDSFYKPSHQLIFGALLDLYQEGKPVDEIILAEKLRSKSQLEEIGGHAYLSELTDRIATPAHLLHYLEHVRDTALLRRLIRSSTQTIERAYSGSEDIDQFLDQVEQEIFRLSEDRVQDTAKPLKASIDAAVKMVNTMLERRGELTGISTGFIDLDKMTYGLHPQEMIVVAARPSMGKTSIALNMAEAAILPRNPNVKPVPALMFSLEMSAEQLAMRLICSRARISHTAIKDGFLDKQKQRELVNTATELKSAPLWIDDSGHITILELRAKARRVHAQQKLGIIYIDYLQLISGTDPRVPREQQISEISRGLKALAKELNVPVVVLGQLNRESEKERRQPRLSDLRESGAIEQDADVVLLLSKRKDANDEQEMATNVVMRDLIIAKQRNGPVGSIPLAFTKSLTRFENYTGETLDPS
ncbi:MAG: replicative DNA helicase [Verrucomicrobia bacterium 21-51-4]|nr:MAG: replicative DNA helicase [Verrucomicrobia bacterium 21-51-4]HQU09041.1 replicative DNA helicase [Opitutales bacterium]